MLTCLPIILGAAIYGCPTPTPAENTHSEVEQVYFEKQVNCLAINIYHEARSQTIQAQQAVAFVTINRALSSNFPNTICSAVYQANKDTEGQLILNECQFSWVCDGKSDKAYEYVAYDNAYVIAETMLSDYEYFDDFTDGATFYHADYVTPYWAKSFELTITIESQLFYKEY